LANQVRQFGFAFKAGAYPPAKTSSSALGAPALHDRMPVILSAQAYDPWLDPGNQDAALLGRLLEEKALSELKFHPVTREVNSVGHNDPSNLEPVQMEFGF